VLTALVLAGAPAHAAAGEGPSLAVLGDKAEVAPLSALLQVKLGQEGLVLVERKELDKVLNEQKLSASGLVQLDALVKVGRLVRADAFLLLSSQKTKPVAAERGYGAPTAAASGAGLPDGEAGEAEADAQPEWLVRARLTETAHGVRLLDWFVAWDPQKVEQAAAEVAARVYEVAPKLKLPAGQVIPVGVVGVRPVELDRESRPACRAFDIMLAARLSKEPRIVVLEREELGRMTGEKALTEGEDAEFWRSGVLIEGYLQRRGKEGIDLNLQLKHPSGEETALAPLPVDLNRLQEAVEKAVQAIVLQLTSSPSAASWDPAREAEVFYRQAGLLGSMNPAALPCAETAVALDPGNEDYCLRLLLYALNVSRVSLAGAHFQNRLELAEMVSRFLPIALKRIRESPHSDQSVFWLAQCLLGYFNSPRSVGEALETNRKNRKMFATVFGDWYLDEGMEIESRAAWLAVTALTASSTTAEGLANLKEAVRQLVMPPDEGGTIASDDERARGCCALLDSLVPAFHFVGAHHLEDLDNTLRRGFLAYLQELSGGRDPIVRVFGCLAVGKLVRQPGSLYPRSAPWREQRAWDEKETAFFAALDCAAYLDKAFAAYRERTSALPALGADAKGKMLVCLFRAANEFYPPEKRVSIYESLCDPLTEERDVAVLSYVFDRVHLTLRRAGRYGTPEDDPGHSGVPPSLAVRALHVLDKVGGVLAGQADQADAVSARRKVSSSVTWIRDAWRTYLRRLESSASALEREGRADQAQAARKTIAEILGAFPDLAAKPKPPGLSVKMLVRKEDWPVPWNDWGHWEWRPPEAKDGLLWLAVLHKHSKLSVGLAGVDVGSGGAVALWQTTFKLNRGGPFVGRPALAGEKSYLAVSDEGLIEFPGALARGKGFLDRPRILNKDNGLPPGRILGIAPLGEKLWISYTDAGTGLGIYDPRTETWQRVCSSDRPADMPLQKVVGYGLFELTPVPGGLMFFVGGANYQDLNGLWRFDSATGDVERLFSFSPRPPTDNSPTVLKGTDGGPWILSSTLIAHLVPQSAKVELSALADFNSTIPENLAKYHQGAWTCEMLPFVSGRGQERNTVAWLPQSMVNAATGAVRGDDFWARYGATQIIVCHRGKSFDEATIMDNNILEGRAVLDFFPTPYGLIAVGQGCIGLIEGSP
jgi:hypothetical protein